LFGGQLGELMFAIRFLLLDGRQLAVELGNPGLLCGRLFQHLGGRGHSDAHFIDCHVFDQLEGQQAN